MSLGEILYDIFSLLSMYKKGGLFISILHLSFLGIKVISLTFSSIFFEVMRVGHQK